MQLVVHTDGSTRCLYGEAIELKTLGALSIQRASHVEPDKEGKWLADLSPVGGPVLGPFGSRREALSAEEAWILAFRL